MAVPIQPAEVITRCTMSDARTFLGCEIGRNLVPHAPERSALADKIVGLSKSGALPSPFGVSDIRKHFYLAYSDNHIRSVMANYCTGTGYWAVEGRTARFKRHSRGKYICL